MNRNLFFSANRTVLLLAAATFTFVPAAAQAQTSSMVVKPDISIAAPAGSGSAKVASVRMSNGGGSGSCFLHVDNHTRFYVEIYTDGEYRGIVKPFGDSTGAVGCGYVTFSGVARFSDGSTRTWGSSTYYVPGSFTWTLWP
jgi:hypothetical protein